jgi:cytochrome-b5 reductase
MFAQLGANFRRAGVVAFAGAAGVGAAYAVSTNNLNASKANADSAAALNAKEYRSFPLESKTVLSPNTALYRFKLPTPDSEAGLNVASCLMAQAEVDGKTVTRPYTPVSTTTTTGHLDLVR